MNLYVIRHGQTNCNKSHKYNCRFDEDINETGEMEAANAINNIKNLDIDLIMCSPLKRARHTCDIININKVDVIYDDRLMERIGGVLTNTVIDDEYNKNEFFNYYSKDIKEGLEPLPVLFKRVSDFIDEIKEKYKDKNILLVTHGAVGMAIKYYFEEIPSEGLLLNRGLQKNCEVIKYEVK